MILINAFSPFIFTFCANYI
uniref:Uncharacterized protein n=1 Tax=Arundo donax TaxID=35708 RepID=A0A0A8ZF80_ARUDO